MPSGRSATHLSSPPGGGSLQGEVPPPTDLEVLVQPPHNLEASKRCDMMCVCVCVTAGTRFLCTKRGKVVGRIERGVS